MKNNQIKDWVCKNCSPTAVKWQLSNCCR